MAGMAEAVGPGWGVVKGADPQPGREHPDDVVNITAQM